MTALCELWPCKQVAPMELVEDLYDQELAKLQATSSVKRFIEAIAGRRVKHRCWRLSFHLARKLWGDRFDAACAERQCAPLVRPLNFRVMHGEVTSMLIEPLASQDVPVSSRKTLYPPPFASRVAGRVRQRLGDHFGLTNFGVNLTELAPGCLSALLHHHTKQDEFVYIVSGSPTLIFGDLERRLTRILSSGSSSKKAATVTPSIARM